MSTKRTVVTKMTLDMFMPDIQKTVTVTQGDVNRRFEITLVDSGRPFRLGVKWTVALAAVKPSGHRIYNSCIVDNGKIIYDFAGGPEIATEPGTFEVLFDIYDEVGEVVASPKIWLSVLVNRNREMQSEDQFTATQDILRRLNETEEQKLAMVQEAVSTAESAVAAANGALESAQTVVNEVESALTAELTRQSNEQERVSAESKRSASESSRVGNEMLRGSAEASRAEAERIRQTNEQSRADAESTRAAAEEMRDNAEASRESAEASRNEMETDRAEAELARKSNEQSRADAESTRASAETKRANAESSRVNAETSRIDAEAGRVSSERERTEAELTRKSNEQGRADAESARVAAEKMRANADAIRTSAETARKDAETGRANAEEERAEAERTRQTKEQARADVQSAHASAEAKRASAETSRASAETSRKDAETNRTIAEEERKTAESVRGDNEIEREKLRAELLALRDELVELIASLPDSIEGVPELTNRVNAVLDSDDETLDELSEIVAYIKSNKSLIEAITTSKVGVSDIVNNLVSDVSDKPLSAAMGVKLKELVSTTQSASTEHAAKKDNPHGVTKAQVGLGNVPNVATNDQTPTFTEASTLENIATGEKVTTLFGKIKKAISGFITHLADKSNPHGVTKSDVGLGNVENKSSAEIRGEITKANVTTALGYTPPQSDTKYTHPSHTARSKGLYKVTVDSEGHVSEVEAVTKADITGLGIPAQDTTYTHPALHPASMIDGLAAVAKSGSYNDLDNKPTIPAAVTVDTALSATSTNPVQNKVIKSALDGKAPSSHGNHVPTPETANNAKFLRNDNTWQTVTPANIGAAAYSHNQAASTITAGTFAGKVVANASGQTPSVFCLRNSKLVSAEENPTVNGEICWTFK